MKAIHKKRLLKLATHLEGGKLGHKRFDFSEINVTPNPYVCGTAGCAMGELPVVFPKDWMFTSIEMQNVVFLRKSGSRTSWHRGVEQYFDISEDEMDHLFYPQMQEPEKYGGQNLNYKATAKQVAANIRAFVKVKEGAK